MEQLRGHRVSGVGRRVPPSSWGCLGVLGVDATAVRCASNTDPYDTSAEEEGRSAAIPPSQRRNNSQVSPLSHDTGPQVPCNPELRIANCELGQHVRLHSSHPHTSAAVGPKLTFTRARSERAREERGGGGVNTYTVSHLTHRQRGGGREVTASMAWCICKLDSP